MNALANWIQGRSDAEKRLLAWAVPVILSLLLYLVLVQPLVSAWLERRAELDQRRSDLDWLRNQVTLVERTTTACDPAGELLGPDRLRAGIESSARRLGLTARIGTSPAGAGYEVQLTGDGDAILRLVANLSCLGGATTSLQLDRPEVSSAEASATLQIQWAG